MKTVFLAVTVTLCVLLSMAPSVFAQNAEDFMATLYGGLADIMENNMNNPAKCIAETENFLDGHQALIQKMQRMSEKNQEAAQEEQFSAQDLQKAQAAMATMMQSKGMLELNRFIEAVQMFDEQNPQFSEQLDAVMKKMDPQSQVE